MILMEDMIENIKVLKMLDFGKKCLVAGTHVLSTCLALKGLIRDDNRIIAKM